jgi:hypothetical protein
MPLNKKQKRERLEYYDARSPAYYEKRAGHPPPTSEWYRNTNDSCQHVRMTFSQENFVRGFDLTVGEYYKVRQVCVNEIISRQVFKKDFKKSMAAKLEAWMICDVLYTHELLQNKPGNLAVPAKWRDDMIWSFISGMCTFVRNNQPKFRIERVAIDAMEVGYSTDDIRDDEQKVSRISLAQLIPQARRRQPDASRYHNPEDMEFDLLVDHLRDELSFDPDKHDVTFVNPRAGNRAMSVHGNIQLAYALKALPEYGSRTMKMQITKMNTIIWPYICDQ